MLRNIIAGMLLLSFSTQAKSQQYAEAKNIFEKISYVYDTSTNLSFQIRISNTQITDSGKISTEQAKGTYALKGNKALYNIGQVEVMQTDSFFVSVWKEDRLMVAADTKKNKNSRFFPFRETMDSLLNISEQRYIISTELLKSGVSARLVFSAKDEKEKVKSFIMEYDLKTHLLVSLKYIFNDQEPGTDNEGNEVLYAKEKTMMIEVFDYSHNVINNELFQKELYITKGTFEPSETFKGFTIHYSPVPEAGQLIKE